MPVSSLDGTATMTEESVTLSIMFIKYWADGAWQVLHEQSHGQVDPNGGHAYFEFGYTIPDNGSVKA